MITYRELHTHDEFQQVVQLQTQVWGMDAAYSVPDHTLRIVDHIGGVVTGALDGERVVGFAFAFPGLRDDDPFLWSDMAGVHPDYQGRGIGRGIKFRQREWALAHGYDRIAWTYDPLQRRNAHFNLRHLGAVGEQYHVNFYGAMQDSINAGLDSDRLEVMWHLNAVRVKWRAAGKKPDIVPQAKFILAAKNGQPQLHLPDDWSVAAYALEIPYDINSLKQRDMALALAWQRALREAMQSAIARYYRVVDFKVRDKVCWYVVASD